jgi:hypothetical protein
MRFPFIDKARRPASNASRGERRPWLELLEERLAPADLSMLAVARTAPPAHPSPILWLNFEGGKNGGGRPFAETNGNIPGFNTERDIQEVLFLTQEIFAPFDVTVKRWFASNEFDRGDSGNTTVFIGDDSLNTRGGVNGTYAYAQGDSVDVPGVGSNSSTHLPNSNPYDVCWVDPFSMPAGGAWSKLSNLAIAQNIAHEAGHTFGLAHVRSDGTADPAPLGVGTVNDVMAYDATNQFFSAQVLQVTAYNNTGTQTIYQDSMQPKWATEFFLGIVVATDDINKQSSFDTLTYVLGARPDDGDYRVANAGSVDPSVDAVWRPQGNTLSLNTLVDGTLSREGEWDVHRRTAVTGEVWRVGLLAPSGNANLTLLVYDGAGNLVTYSNDPNTAITAQAGVTYYFVIGSMDGVGTGSYQLVVRQDPLALGTDGALTISGDRLGTTRDDVITLDVNPARTRILVTVNGEVRSYPISGAGQVRSVRVNTGIGNDRVNVLRTHVTVPTFITSRGVLTAQLGSASLNLDGIRGDLVINGSGNGQLVVNDQASTTPTRFNLSVDTLALGVDTPPRERRSLDRVRTRLAPTPGGPFQFVSVVAAHNHVTYRGISGLTINGGSGGNSFAVSDFAPRSDSVSSMPITLNTGAGADRVGVRYTSGSLVINGNNGFDAVELGGSAGVRNIGAVSIDNTGGRTALVVNDAANTQSRTVRLSTTGATGFIDGLNGAAMISYAVAQRNRGGVNTLDVRGGSGNNVFHVYDTIGARGGRFLDLDFVNSFRTSLSAGPGHDSVRVYATAGPLDLDLGAGLNDVTVGSRRNLLGQPLPLGSLDRIGGAITVHGAGGVNSLHVDDSASTTAQSYVVDGDFVQRSDKARVTYRDVTTLTLTAGAGSDQITVRDTGPAVVTDLRTGGGSDVIGVARTSGPLAITAGAATVIEVGTATSSLDAIQGSISVYPQAGNSMTLRLNDTAATTGQTLFATGSSFVQSYARSGAAAIHVNFDTVKTFEYLGGSGGTRADVSSTAPGTSTAVVGRAGVLDIFSAGFATDTNKLLGLVLFVGQAADGDFAYHYDFLNPNPLTYTVRGQPAFGTSVVALAVERPAVAPVYYINLAGVSLYAPTVGGNEINVRSSPAGTQLGIAAGDGDRIRLGSNAPNRGGTVDAILGHVFLNGGLGLVVDDSGNTTTARQVRLSTYEFVGNRYGLIEGLTPGGVTFLDRAGWNVQLFGGTLDDRFLMSGAPLATRMEIDGGNGNDVLVGTGGIILRGGEGRDLLIAGAQASYLYGDDFLGTAGQDLLIGGTTIYDADLAKLDEIMAVWASGVDYHTRAATLRNGLLSAGTVTANGGQNLLYGMQDKDLFWASLGDETDLNLDGVNTDEEAI